MKTKTMTKKAKGVSGTKEWAASSVNVMTGCKHECLYCYASASAFRFDRVKHGEWSKETLKMDVLTKRFGKRQGTIMFPTAHDITPENLGYCTTVLLNMLRPGNQVLIVSKPSLTCIEQLTSRLADYKNQILFRFTIGSLDGDVCEFWEPGAPSPGERVAALATAFSEGFKTSVSMEPMLDTDENKIIHTVATLSHMVSDAIWLGKANKLKERLKRNRKLDETTIPMVDALVASQSEDRILSLYDILEGHPKVKWKESIKKVVGLEVPTEAGLDI
jgi:DNA repair photolyase